MFPDIETAIQVILSRLKRDERFRGCDSFKAKPNIYHDARGDVVSASVRIDYFDASNKPAKEFRMLRAVDGGFVLGGMESGRPLYRLGAVVKAQTVIVVEGEKACEALMNVLDSLELPRPDIAVTTSMGGAQAPAKSDWSPLAGKTVFLWPDADDAGTKYARNVAHILGKLPTPPVMRVLVVAGLPEKGDAHDWVGLLSESAEPEDILAALIELLEGSEPIEAPREPEEEGRIIYQRFSLPKLLSLDLKQEYLIDGFLVGQEPCIFAGPSKSLKTTLMLDLAVALASGGRFLGCGFLQANRVVRVGVMSGESGLPTIQETLGRICRAAHVQPDAVGDNLLLSPDLPRFGDKEHEAAVRRFIERDRLEVLVIDPAYLSVPVGENASNMFSVGELIRSISVICAEMKCMMMLLHHARKNRTDQFEPMELSDIAWSGFDQFARQWLTTNRRSTYQRGSGVHHLWLGCGGSAGHGGLWGLDIVEGLRCDAGGRGWDVTVLSETEARANTNEQIADCQASRAVETRARKEWGKEQEDRKRILVYLNCRPGASRTNLRNESGARQTKLWNVLGSMIEDGSVVHRIRTTRGKPVDYFWPAGHSEIPETRPPQSEVEVEK